MSISGPAVRRLRDGTTEVPAALGTSGALGASRLPSKLLFGVTPTDPITVSVVAVLMAVVGTLACWLPATRAAKVEPAVALTAE